ncbi:uroporphyrinogen-III synthase [Balneolaceae bacterium YR4-1]|uniref:Uroporphyrinogen-III synthase n=1 Tax=Halalkalibaculum roseum TaxID=2709311 RepID=A0A6M1SZZ1_9BACT|nr:uroporphyrinogen-III synthase [Halalkalibaculum roseum]NGP75415.1 uroporphyrinogen-III synthase [Halalkalibaculum roseum]
MTSGTTVLLTAAKEDSEEIRQLLKEKKMEVFHFPLEIYVPVKNKTDIEETFSQFSEFKNIVHGSIRNARFFIREVESMGKIEEVRKILNLTLDEDTATYLEESGVPAVCTYAGNKSINLVEFMLRLRRMGATLYPCGSHHKEEIPGFLEELDIPVKELELFDLEGPEEADLKSYRQKLAEKQPEAVLFHSRRSVTRTLAAFPELDYESVRVISADKGISKKLSENGIEVDDEADGSWVSLAELL